MTLEELQGLSTAEAIDKAAAYAGVRPEVLDNMWATESARGTHPTMIGPPTKYGRAKGHFQQLDNIHATWEQRTGKKLDRMRFEDGLFMTALQLRENMDRTKDESLAVTMYHGGTDPKNWGPKTQAYVASITGGPISQQAVADMPRKKKVSAKAMRAPSYEDIYDVSAQDVEALYKEAAPVAPPPLTSVFQPRADGSNESALAAIAAGEAVAVAAQKKIDDTTFFGEVKSVDVDLRGGLPGAVLSGTASVIEQLFGDRNTVAGAAVNTTRAPYFRLARRLSGDLDRPVDPEWSKELAGNLDFYLGGLDEDQQDEVLSKSTSKQDYEDRIFRIQERREDDLVMGRVGTGKQLLAGVLSGAVDPASYVIGAGTALSLGRLGLGSAALIQAGRPGAAAASVIGENVAGNELYELAQAAMGEHRSLGDYGMAAIGGLVPGAVFGGMAYKQAVHEFKLGVQQKIIKEKFDLAVQAIKNAGEDASPATIKAEMTRLENEHYEQTAASRGAGPSAGDKIESPNLDESPELLGTDGEQAPTPRTRAAEGGTGPATTQVVPTAESAYVGEGAWKDIEAQNRATPEKVTRFGAGDIDTLLAHPAGTHLAPTLSGDMAFTAIRDSIEKLRQQIAPDLRLIVTDVPVMTLPDGRVATPDGVHYPVGEKTSIIAVKKGGAAGQTLVHEFGHALEAHYLHNMPPEIRNGVYAAFQDFAKLYDKPGAFKQALLMRGGVQRAEGAPLDTGMSLRQEQLSLGGEGQAKYMGDFGEWTAEQMVKYVESGSAGVGPGADLKLTTMLKQLASDLVRKFLSLFNLAKRENLLRADARFEDFIKALREGAETNNALAGVPVAKVAAGAQLAAPTPVPRPGKLTAADAALSTKHGLDLMPRATPRERAEFKAVLDLYRKADEWAVNNPRDDAKVKVLGNNSLVNVALPATLLATSDNSLSRMVAGTLLEQSTGALGRRNTAAILKYSLEQGYIGNALLDYDQAYTGWRNANGGGWIEDTFKGDRRNAFNRLVATEVEQRRAGVTTQADALVKRAADTLEQGYERMRLSQVDTKTVGWARLPDTSVGYMPHRIAANRLRDASDAELRVFTNTLTEQFVGLNDWDLPFAQEMARKYLDHARVRSLGGHDIPANIHDPAAAEMVRGALTAMNMTPDEVLAQMGRFGAGGPSHTKKRAVLNLTTEYPDGKGGVFRLMDMFDTDHVSLLRNQARRVSGEVALAQHGIMGSQGLKLLRRGLEFGNHKLSPEDLAAFDQVAAEMLGNPFGTATGKWMERTMTANTLARLGGMGWTQLGESLNGIWAVGAEATMHSVTSMPRLRGEVAALARGETVKNGILHSMEQPGGGGEFGLDGYKMVTAFDSPEHAYASYGHDSATWVDRAMRRGAHALGTLSMHRMIHAVQRRGMAEQITLKAIRFIRDGGESKALADMGFTPDVVARLKADLPNMVQYDASGRVREFDITKAKDLQAARAFSQSVHRGAAQIIQGSFIGEQGKWAHNGFLKVLTQFRSFPLVAMEKQWARQRGMHGVAGALGILTGSMAMVAPIYMARVAFSAIGRPDREEYLEQRLSPQAIARATLNYVGVAGLSGDLLDLLSTATGIGQTSGGRTGTGNKSFVSTTIPGVGYVDDVYRAATNPSDPAKWARILPFNNVPLMVPAINALRPD